MPSHQEIIAAAEIICSLRKQDLEYSELMDYMIDFMKSSGKSPLEKDREIYRRIKMIVGEGPHNKKIAWIKEYRSITGAGLKESKAKVEWYAENYHSMEN